MSVITDDTRGSGDELLDTQNQIDSRKKLPSNVCKVLPSICRYIDNTGSPIGFATDHVEAFTQPLKSAHQ